MLARINDELSKSREAFEASKVKTDSTVEKMNAAGQTNETLKREIDAAEAEMEERRRRRHEDAATKARDAEALMEEMKRKREETKKEKAREAKEAIERELSDGGGGGGEETGFARMTEEIRKFEEDELMREQNRERMKITDAATEEALDAIDALESGAAAWTQDEAVMKELSAKGERVISGLIVNDDDDAALNRREMISGAS